MSGLRDGAHQSSRTLLLPVGALDGLGSLSYSLAKPLQEFTRQYGESRRSPENTRIIPEWDLRKLQYPRVNIAALTAFIAVAHRLRLFSEEKPQARLTWNPKVFGFLQDAGVIDILRKNDLVNFPREELAGYWHEVGRTNPSTRFFFLDATADAPSDPGKLIAWKDEARRELTGKLFDYTKALFKPSKRAVFDPRIVDSIVSATAELSLNANFWGRCPAAVGLQRSPHGITVAVADCGEGLVKSLRDKGAQYGEVADHPTAALLAAVHNRREYGLFRVIEEITSLPNGWVSLWSFDTELYLRRPLWESVRGLTTKSLFDRRTVPLLTGRVDDEIKRTGYLRQWSSGIRGVRVTFEISFDRGRVR
jgi:hypothetical protein